MFTAIPEDLAPLSAAEMRALRATVKAEVKAKLAEDKSPDVVAAAKKAMADCDRLQVEADAKDLAEAAEPDPEPEPKVEVKVETPVTEPEAAAEVKVETPVEKAEEKTAEEAAEKVPAKVRTGVGVASVAEVDPKANGGMTDRIFAFDGERRAQDRMFESWSDVAAAIIDRAESRRPDSPEKSYVAQVRANYPEERRLPDTGEFGFSHLRLFDEKEVTAALCTLPDVDYGMACWSVTRRPVFGSLPRYQGGMRGSTAVYPSPSLHDITTGYGQWTFEDDDDDNAEKECAEIDCGDPETFRWYGIYRCMTIKHLMLMTFPELVEAWLNRLAAATARYAETLLLEAMEARADTITAQSLGFNASTSLATQLIRYLTLYQEVERWDAPAMRAWMPRWILGALKADQMSRRNTSGEVLRVPSDGEIRALFTDVGVDPVFTLDTASWMTDVPDLATTGVLGQWPANLEMLVAPVGKYAVMDRGQLNIGVTGTNYYRDTANLKKNEITFFVESFEGPVDTTSCPAHVLQFNNLCFNGVQIDDITIACQGQDEPGINS